MSFQRAGFGVGGTAGAKEVYRVMKDRSPQPHNGTLRLQKC